MRRHAGLVYGTARRRVGSADLADDVTQATFIILARKARTVSQRQSLPAWLFRTARYASLDALRRRRTRQRHERTAATEKPEAVMPTTDDNTLAVITPRLDAALDLLPARDREAILLRFFENQTLEDIGRAQHIAASTVQRRLQQALSRLSHELKRRGVAPAPAALVGALTAFGLAPAPASATAGVTALATAAGALPATTAGPIGLAKGTMKTMTMLKPELAAVAAALCIGLAGVEVVRHRSAVPGAAAAPSPADLIRPGVGIAGLRVGMTATEVTAVFGPAEISLGGPSDLRWPSRGLTVDLDTAGHVVRIMAGDLDPTHAPMRMPFRTAESVRAGATTDAVLAAYGSTSVRAAAEPGTELIEYWSRGIAFKTVDGRVAVITVMSPDGPQAGAATGGDAVVRGR